MGKMAFALGSPSLFWKSTCAIPASSSSISTSFIRTCRPTHCRALIHTRATIRIRTITCSSAPSTPSPSQPPFQPVQALLTPLPSIIILTLLESIFKNLFKLYHISFPPALFSMLLTFSTLMAMRTIHKPTSDAMVEFMKPGVNLISKWLAVFFVPILVALPVARMPSVSDTWKCLFVVVIGLLASMVSTAYISLGLAKMFNVQKGAMATSALPPKPAMFSKTITIFWGLCAIGSMALSLAAPAWRWAQVLFGTSLTLFGFCLGQQLPAHVKKFIHPLVSCAAITMAGLIAFGTLLGRVDTLSVIGEYFTKSPVLASQGAGDLLLAVLGPGIVSFAFQMYARWDSIKEHPIEVFGSTLLASLLSLFGTASLARLIGISPHLRLVLAPRMITAPLAIPIAEILRVDSGLAATAVSLTGLLGGNFYKIVLDACKVEDPVARGLATGASAHGVGSAAILGETEAFPFAVIAMTLVGIMSTILVFIPAVRNALIATALGASALVAR